MSLNSSANFPIKSSPRTPYFLIFLRELVQIILDYKNNLVKTLIKQHSSNVSQRIIKRQIGKKGEQLYRGDFSNTTEAGGYLQNTLKNAGAGSVRRKCHTSSSLLWPNPLPFPIWAIPGPPPVKSHHHPHPLLFVRRDETRHVIDYSYSFTDTTAVGRLSRLQPDPFSLLFLPCLLAPHHRVEL